jgi:pimeloyl-ACP methyl ester carboxylesterase
MDLPETRYAKSGDVHIAYQVAGAGPFDLVCVYGSANNIETAWDFPEYAHFMTRLASFARVIMFDKRGTGLSDRTVGIAPLEERMDDVRAVMDAAGSERAALFGVSEGGPMSMLFAATYPERTQALVLCGTFARPDTADLSADEFGQRLEQIEHGFGTGAALPRWVASRASDEAFRRAWARFERQSASPGAMVRLMQMNREIDVRHILPTIRVPTLVLHRSGDPHIGLAHALSRGPHSGRQIDRAAGYRPYSDFWRRRWPDR